MKLSSTWFALILIASALLLSADANVTAESISQQNQSTSAERTAQAVRVAPHPSVTQIIQPTANPTADERGDSTYGQSKQACPSGNDLPAWLQAIATILLVAFAAYQMRFIKRATGATEDSAKAAKDSALAAQESAKAAAQAVHADRPLIIVQEIDPHLDWDNRSLAPNVIFHNYGHSPAILIDVFLGLQTCRGDEIHSLTPDIVSHWPFTRHSIQKQVVADGEPAEEMITVKLLHPKVFAEMLEKQTAQVAHGIVRYRGAFELDEPYESHFCWFFLAPDVAWPNGKFVIGPKELNQTT